MSKLEQAVIRGNKREKTKHNYLSAVRAFEEWAGSRKHTGALLEDWRDYLLEEGLAPSTVNTHLAALRYASKRLSVLYDEKDFARGIEGAVVKDRKKIRLLTVGEIKSLYAACPDDPAGRRDYALFMLGFHTGMRRYGLSQVKFSDIADDRDITFPLKGGKKGTTPLGDNVLNAIYDLPYDRGRIFRSMRKGIEGWTMGPSLSPDGIYKALRNRAIQAGVYSFHPHMMRHAFVSYAREAGVPDWRIAQVTFHSIPDAVSSMIEHYTHLIPDADKIVGDLLPF